MDSQHRTSSPSDSRRVIYDLGANNGDNVPYYLLKSDLVVAVEANPVLCDQMRRRFRPECDCGRLVVENKVLLESGVSKLVDFWVHRRLSVLSQFPRPETAKLDEFERVRVEGECIVDLVRRHGNPYYLKSDLERYDAPILAALFAAGIKPPFLSSECHDPQVLAAIVGAGYRVFKLVDGDDVYRKYRNLLIVDRLTGAVTPYSFPHHSAGPFGDDVRGPWISVESIFARLGIEGFGWKDVHATTSFDPGDVSRNSILALMGMFARTLAQRAGARARVHMSRAIRRTRLCLAGSSSIARRGLTP